uniref:Autophagy-related protein 17 n=1 Tax=Ganoderma boninense TaxID=34458 RepID=A0A5K1K206_9APHY|nr:Autophagy-related protein 17 [Ganoderma boninense]
MPQSHTPHDDDSTSPLLQLFSSLNLDLTSTPESITLDPQSHLHVESWNLDVMHIIMSYADRRVVSNLMRTCNALNYAGTKYLLADGLTLRHKIGLLSFLFFLHARGTPGECIRRLTLLNKLSIDLYKPTENVPPILQFFFEILALAASNLTFLHISAAEALLALHPTLGPAIAKLRTLKTIDISETGVHCATLLRTLRSSLVTAKIHFGVHSAEPEEEVPPEPDMNPILLLEGSQSTLESLSASFPVSRPDGPCYANVTRLELFCTGLPYVEDYIRAFPNIQSLTYFHYAALQAELSWHERRVMAMQYQTHHGTWQSLRKLQGSLLLLWVWGLMCHIPSVELSFEQLGVDPNFLNDIILDVRPSDLALRLPGASWLLDDAVRDVLSQEGRLQVLELCVLFNINEADQTVVVEEILDLLVDVVRASSMPTFKLSLDLTWMRVVRRRAESDGGNEMPLMPFEVYLRDMDVDAYGDMLLGNATSLKEAQVSVVEDRDGCTRHAVRRRREPSESAGNAVTTRHPSGGE